MRYTESQRRLQLAGQVHGYGDLGKEMSCGTPKANWEARKR